MTLNPLRRTHTSPWPWVVSVCSATVDAVEQLSKHQELQQRFEQKDGDPLFIVATQMTCRGIDLKGVDVVYITALAKNTDEYQHLAGRSGREGRVGKAISFLDQDEVAHPLQCTCAALPEKTCPRA